MHFPVFDSRDAACKTPYGAVPCGTRVTLTLYPECSEGFDAGAVVLYGEFGDHRQEVELTPAGVKGEHALFTCSFTAPEKPELIW